MVLNPDGLSPERELVEDILAIVHVYARSAGYANSWRLYGLRKYKSAIKEDSDLPKLRTGKSLEEMVSCLSILLQPSDRQTERIANPNRSVEAEKFSHAIRLTSLGQRNAMPYQTKCDF